MILPLAQLDRISDIAKERYMTMKEENAFPFTYAMTVFDCVKNETVYQQLVVDYRHDVGVYICLSKEKTCD